MAYSWLMRLFDNQLDHEAVEHLKNDEQWQAWEIFLDEQAIAAGIEAKQWLLDLDSDEMHSLDKLQWDFTKLFLGPMALLAPPWESTYFSEDRLVFQESTLDVRRAYLKYNFICKGYPNEADDHIAYELDFMQRLSALTYEAINNEQWEEAKALINDQSAFLDEHLLKWIGLFSQNIIEHAETPFYKGVAYVLQGFIEKDQLTLLEIKSAITGS